MRVKIYQINSERDKNHVKFSGHDYLAQFQGANEIDSTIYDEVFNGELDTSNLEMIFQQFNCEGHPLHRGHSLSVSDIVVMDDSAYFCDNIGFKQVSFDESLTHNPDNLMRVIYVEPKKPPYVAEIEHSLRAEQKAVGGLIEPIYNDDGTCLVGNEEAKNIGLEDNRRIGDGSSIIAGSFFVVGLTDDDFRSLTESEVTTYMDRFAEPEDIGQDEVEADTGFEFYPM